MPISVPPKSRREAACSIPPSPASSEDEGAGKSSTSSLLSPSFHQSFPRLHLKEQEEDTTSASRGMSISQRSKHHSVEHIRNRTQQNESPVADTLSPWEEWFLCKEKELRARLQAQALEELNMQMEKRKEKQERERKKKVAELKHKEWVQKKNEEERRAREHKLSEEMAEKTAKELEKAQSKEKAKEVYEEWLKKKRSEEVMKKKEEKEKERQLEAELQEKKEKSEKMFKEWLQNTRNKPRPTSASYAYANGKLTGYPDGNAYPAPAFYNPIPWKPIVVQSSKEEKYVLVKKNKRPMSSHAYKSPPVFFHKFKNKLYNASFCTHQR
ncbi:coiled-coil domain-containing protein 34 isoform X2 [Heteronotia binoei]|uniref:coiled-coil domain-containing protein 34 isoform X2 n=1 Tax=Heteronotia binoei TaxID=13085 RepID=UPI00292DFD7C|nr:coiled-coil domain-containing protein 34 isoform X2 [Heteronotia binoei]XP_060117057.1 coiled-coil domain-containing protein 34 isoform X2 [Heteronotia binoei]